jgi:hypothetical protein
VGLGKKMTGAGFFFFDLLTLNRNFCNLKFYANLKASKLSIFVSSFSWLLKRFVVAKRGTEL